MSNRPAPPKPRHRGSWAAGQRRLIYTDTVSALEAEAIGGVMRGDAVRTTRVLLTAGEATVRERLGLREVGSQYDVHVERSLRMARRLAEQAPEGTVRVPTDGRSVPDIAAEVVRATAR